MTTKIQETMTKMLKNLPTEGFFFSPNQIAIKHSDGKITKCNLVISGEKKKIKDSFLDNKPSIK